MRTISFIILLSALVLPTVAFAEMQTISATHTYILGDHDSKDDARQRCDLEAKRKILEQAGVYIESVSEVKNLDLTKDKITSFAAAVMQVKDTKEDVSFKQGHMTLTLKLTAQVDLVEVRKQLAARQLDAGVRDTVAAQQDRLKYLEARLEAMQQQEKQAPGQRTISTANVIFTAADVQMVRTQAARGDREAQAMLGNLYHMGNGVPQDYVQARQWYERAAAQGHAVAQGNLAVMYRVGQGVPQDHGKARQWYEKAAALGNGEAQARLAVMYHMGQGGPQDYAQAAYWFEKAAIQGGVEAQVIIGNLYVEGKGVSQDYVKARQWYEKAAAQGNDTAQYYLGLFYNNGGEGIQQDYVQAMQWSEKAAAQGNPFAQAALGSRYYFGGDGVAKDYVRSYLWSSLAARNEGVQLPVAEGVQVPLGSVMQSILVRLEGTMTPQQLQEARQLVRDWRPKKENTRPSLFSGF
ncbi:MAG: tetratricopeptide repeat protein [Nitrospira sp.]